MGVLTSNDKQDESPAVMNIDGLEYDSDWVDDPDDGFQSITLSIAQRAGINKPRQPWGKRRSHQHQSWESEMAGLCNAIF